MISSPKDRFQQAKENVSFMETLVYQPKFLEAIDVALLELEARMNETDDMQTAAARFNKMCGAKEYIRILMSLAELPKPGPAKIKQNL